MSANVSASRARCTAAAIAIVCFCVDFFVNTDPGHANISAAVFLTFMVMNGSWFSVEYFVGSVRSAVVTVLTCLYYIAVTTQYRILLESKDGKFFEVDITPNMYYFVATVAVPLNILGVYELYSHADIEYTEKEKKTTAKLPYKQTAVLYLKAMRQYTQACSELNEDNHDTCIELMIDVVEKYNIKRSKKISGGYNTYMCETMSTIDDMIREIDLLIRCGKCGYCEYNEYISEPRVKMSNASGADCKVSQKEMCGGANADMVDDIVDKTLDEIDEEMVVGIDEGGDDEIDDEKNDEIDDKKNDETGTGGRYDFRYDTEDLVLCVKGSSTISEPEPTETPKDNKQEGTQSDTDDKVLPRPRGIKEPSVPSGLTAKLMSWF